MRSDRCVTALLPRLHPRHRPPAGGRGHRRAGHRGQDRGRRARWAARSWPMTIFSCDMMRGRPRPGPGGGHRRQARAAGQRGVHLPGRRRPGRHRHGRDGPRRHARREHHRHLRQQRHLRHDRRPDGPHHACRARSPRPPPTGATSKTAGYPVRVCEMLSSSLDGVALPRARDGGQRQERAQGEEGHQEGLPEPGRRQGLLDGGGAVHLPDQLGPHSGRTRSSGCAENMLPYYPLGVYKDVVADGFANAAEAAAARAADCPIANPAPATEGGAR